MAAIISASGTWSLPTFDTTKSKVEGNARRLEEYNFEASLATGPDELQQFVQLVATAASLHYHQALVIVEKWLVAERNRGDREHETTERHVES